MPLSQPADARRRLLLLGVAGLGLSLGGANASAKDFDDPDDMYEALRTAPTVPMAMPGGRLEIIFSAEVPAAQRPAILGWIEHSATAVTRYFGRFPVDRAGLVVTSSAGRRVGHGTTWGYAGPAIRIDVGRDADAASFEADWVLVHEMVHLSFPTLQRTHLWIEEGGAVYVEPIARAQAGHLTAERVWRDMRKSLWQGLPLAGDQGLDVTHSWARTYWGGAMFCLLADVEYRRRTDNRLGLQDALRAINRASGGNEARWPIVRALEAGDAACGARVMMALYEAHKDKPVAPPLEALFDQLGIPADGPAFDETAPLAAIRRAITAPRG